MKGVLWQVALMMVCSESQSLHMSCATENCVNLLDRDRLAKNNNKNKNKRRRYNLPNAFSLRLVGLV